MDILPTKFRSPPPKPPRRRHSDQLSISPSGTFPSNRKKHFDENKSCDNRQELENSTSSCDSLPSNWTPDFSVEKKHENISIYKKPSDSNNHAKCISDNFSIVDDIVFYKHKNSVDNNSISCDKSNCTSNSKFEPPYIHHIVKDDFYNSDCNSSNLFENFHIDLSNSKLKDSSSAKNVKHFSTKPLFKEHHRRHNSDPLPSNFDNKNLNPFFQFSSDLRNKLLNSENSCKTKENHYLLLEVKSLKEINTKLWEHLCFLQTSLDSFKKHSSCSTSNLSVSDLLSSLYNSLKAKENAMEDRMKIISQERDNAVQDLDSMVQIVAGSFEDNYYCTEKSSDKEVKELLKEIEVTCSPVKLLQQQRLLLSHLYRSKELKQDHMRHEMKLIASERDSLREKVKVLEDELSQLKLSNDIWNTDNKYWENSLLNTICQVIQQRDVAVKNYNAHNTEYFNSRSSFSEKSFNTDTINDCLQRFDEASVKKKMYQSSQNDVRKYAPFALKSNKSDEVRYLKEELLVLNKSLEIEMEKREHAEEKCVRLERLVNVLQKKINGQNVGIPV